MHVKKCDAHAASAFGTLAIAQVWRIENTFIFAINICCT